MSERERMHMCAHTRVGQGQTERERERIPSRLHTVSTEYHMGLEITNHAIMT